MRTLLIWTLILASSITTFSQVDTSYIYNTSMPYGTLDIRLRKSATRYYYLQPGKTFSFRESAPGVKTNTYRDMTSWDSSPYTQGILREKNGAADYFILNYRLLYPKGYNANYSPGYPIIIMMHGLGERGNCWDNNCYHATPAYSGNVNDPPAPTDPTHRLYNNDHNLLHGGKPHLDAVNLAGTRLPNDPSMPSRAFPGFVLFPQNINGWSVNTIHDVIRLVRLVIKQNKIDPNRVYIHGLSNGGIATYEAIKRAPWLFAAALPMSAPSDGGITSKNLTSKVANIPLWIFQGGLDTAPSPYKTEGYIKAFREAGMSVRYTKYETLGHGVWNKAYGESDFFQFILAQNKSRIQVFADNPAICKTNGTGLTLRLAEGFFAYQWERNGVIISGATGATYVATTAGSYRARFSRVKNPAASDWNQWSQAVVVTEQNPAQAAMKQIGTLLLKDLNNYSNARFEAQGTFAHYYWYKNGTKISLADTVKYPVFTPGDCSAACTGNGDYTLIVAGFDNCPSPPSSAKTVVFNNQAPTSLAAPANFQAATPTQSSVKLTWTDVAGETGFEIWRRKVTGSGTYTAWSMPTITAANATTFTDVSLEPSSTYHFKIRAVAKSSRSNYTPSAATSYLVVTTGGDGTAPSTPGNLTVQQTGVGQLTLKWTASTDNTGIKEYVVTYGTTNVNTGSSSTTYVLSGLPVNRNYSITVKARDLGGNLSAASSAVAGTTYIEGLFYRHSTGAWTSIDAINWSVAEFTGKVTSFTLTPRTQEDYFNFEFDGYVYINTGGSYQFSTVSSDGSRLALDGAILVNNDGVHGSRTVNGAITTISAGARRINVKYFEYEDSQNLSVRYKGPDTGDVWKTIPTTALRSSPGTTAAAFVEAEEIQLSEPERITVYPNPTNPGDLHLRVADENNFEVRVALVDFNGSIRFEKSFQSEELREGINLGIGDGVPPGMYVLTIVEPTRRNTQIVVFHDQ
jgi:Prolyl oligopeptidase family/PA14 domain/Fibronectin type III domain